MDKELMLMLIGSAITAIQVLIMFILGTIKSELKSINDKISMHFENHDIHCFPDLRKKVFELFKQGG